MLFHVQLKRLVCEYTTVPVGAKTKEEAEAIALKSVPTFHWERIVSDVKALVREVPKGADNAGT